MNAPKVTSKELKILDYDLETIAAGFADPNWVPQYVTVIAWSWVGKDKVWASTCLGAGIYGNPEDRQGMLLRFLQAYNEADVVTGHNILRFDQPVLSSECMRLGLPTLGAKLVQDTIRLPKSKGFKKGQDNLEIMHRLPAQKMPLNWQQWQDAYNEPDWHTVVQRCKTDVLGHKQLREAHIERGWLKTVTWKP